jgi:ABC-type nickel/cobalt efflux system permease component RcnA
MENGGYLGATAYVLLATAGGTALLHTLIPDHWLPFVLIGRARGWNGRTTLLVSGCSALVHVLLSICLGLIALRIGLSAAEAIGESMHRAGALLLIVFGIAYAVWAWRKGGHFHPGGNLLHKGGKHAACNGSEGHANPEHLHYHADDALIRGRTGWSALWLALIVGANPCILVLPVMLATVGKGRAIFWLVVLAYSLPTLILTVALSVIGVTGSRKLFVPVAAKYMEAASGLLIALLGVLFWLFEA